METRRLSPEFFVTGQIGSKDVPQLKSMGFQSIICNRPDGEDAMQPSFEMIDTAARLSMIQTRYLPVAPTGPTAPDLAAFQAAFDELPKPVLAYCRTGGRSEALFRMANG